MDSYQRARGIILATVARDTPKTLWEDVRDGAKRTYADAFEQVRNDPNVLNEQRLDKLYQDRYFRMEHLVASLANQHGLACSTTLLAENGRYYVYAGKGAIGLTQTYVPTIGSMPKQARFRERHAAINALEREPRLDLGDQLPELLGKEFYGLIAYNPVGRRFTSDDQRLGMVQVCVPTKCMSAWAVELTLEEIIGVYEKPAPSKKPDRRLPWKPRKDKKEENP
jgi:hypothetical protein